MNIKKKEISCELEFIVAENARIAQSLYLRRLIAAEFGTTMTTPPKPSVIKGLGDHGCRMAGDIYFVRYNIYLRCRFDYEVDINQVEDILLVLDKRLVDRAQPAQKKALLDNIKSFAPPKIFYAFRDTPVSLKVQETSSIKGVLFAPGETKLTKEGVLFNFRVPGQHKLHLAIYNKDTLEFAAIEKKFEVRRKLFPGGPEIESYQIPTEMIQGQWYPVSVTIKSPKRITRISWSGKGFVFKAKKGERREDYWPYGDTPVLWVKARYWLRRHQIVVMVKQEDGKKDAIAVAIKVLPK